MATGEERWRETSEMHLLLFVLAKCAPTIPYSDIAKDFGVSYAAVRSRFDRIRRRYKNELDAGSAGAATGAGEAPVEVKKRKRGANAGDGPARKKKKGKTAQVVKEEDDEENDDQEEMNLS